MAERPPRPPDSAPRSPTPARAADTCPECGHSWEAHDDLGCSASIMPETATWAGQETWCDCERSRPKRDVGTG